MDWQLTCLKIYNGHQFGQSKTLEVVILYSSHCKHYSQKSMCSLCTFIFTLARYLRDLLSF